MRYISYIDVEARCRATDLLYLSLKCIVIITEVNNTPPPHNTCAIDKQLFLTDVSGYSLTH